MLAEVFIPSVGVDFTCVGESLNDKGIPKGSAKVSGNFMGAFGGIFRIKERCMDEWFTI